MSSDDEVFEETGSKYEDPEEGSNLAAVRNTALRWTTMQTSIEIFEDADGYMCQMLAPLGKNDKERLENVLEKMNRILELLDNSGERKKIGELTDG